MTAPTGCEVDGKAQADKENIQENGKVTRISNETYFCRLQVNPFPEEGTDARNLKRLRKELDILYI